MRTTRSAILLALAAGLPSFAQQAGEDKQLMDLLELLDTPVVSASKQSEKLSDAPATVIVISRKDIQVRGYTKFYEILDDLPGYDQMLIYGDTFLKPYTRGFRNEIGESVLLMIDGQVQNHLWYNTIDDPLATMPMSNIKQVEVVYGPASAVYGANAFMGVINVITETGSGDKDVYLHADLIGGHMSGKKFIKGNINQSGIDVTYGQKIGDWRLSITSRIYHGDIDPDAANRYVYTSGNIFLNPNGLGRTIFGKMLDIYGAEQTSPYTAKAFDLRLATPKWEFGIQHSGLRSGYGMLWSWDHYIPNASTWEQPEWSFFSKFDHTFSDTLNTRAVARYRSSQTANDSMDFEVDWFSNPVGSPPSNVLAGQYLGPGFYVLPEHWGVATSAFTYTQDFSWKPSSFLSMNWGITFSEEIQQLKYNFNQGDDLYLFRSDRFDPNLLGQYFPKKPQNLGDSNHARFLRRGGYLQGRMNFTENHGLVLGLRNDWHSGFGDANTIRAGYVGKWGGGFLLKALYGQAYNEPVWRQLGGGWKGSASSLSLKPQRTHTTEVSFGYTAKRWSLSANGYKIRNTGVIVGNINVGVMEITGVDVQGHLLFDIAGKEQKLWLYGTKLFKQTSNPYFSNVNVKNTDEIPDIAKYQIHFGWTATFTRDMTLTLRGRQFAARNTVATNPAARIPGYLVLDAYFQAGIGVPGLSAGLKVTNLLDRAYDQPGMRKGSAGFRQPGFVGGNYVGSAGFNTSLLPQAGRAFEAMVRYQF